MGDPYLVSYKILRILLILKGIHQVISLNGINIGSLDTHYWIFVYNVANSKAILENTRVIFSNFAYVDRRVMGYDFFHCEKLLLRLKAIIKIVSD